MTVIDKRLAEIPDTDQRAALEHVRSLMHRLIPDAEEVISYGIPALKYKGRAVGGFDAFARHLSYFPWGSEAIKSCMEELQDFEMTKSSIHFTPDHMIPDSVLTKLILFKIREIDEIVPG